MQACAALRLEGGGWRLPDRSELFTTAVFSIEAAAHRPAFSDEPSASLWTSTLSVQDVASAWPLEFAEGGRPEFRPRDTPGVRYRCVRGGPPPVQHEWGPRRFVRAGPDALDDLVTGLRWGLPELLRQDHLGAAQWCQSADRDFDAEGADWRLPTLPELMSLIDDRFAQPALPPIMGDQLHPPQDGWSAWTSSEDYDGGHWTVDMAQGRATATPSANSDPHARCVRTL